MNEQVVEAIEELIDRGPSDEEMLAGWVPNYGSGDTELADDIAQAVAAFRGPADAAWTNRKAGRLDV